MKKGIAKLSLMLVINLIALTPFTLVEAKSSSCCCRRWDWCKLDGLKELGAAALYEQACVQNYRYLLSVNRDGNTRVHGNVDIKPHLNWGLKLWGGWYSCDRCYFAFLSWKHLWSNKDSVLAVRNGIYAPFEWTINGVLVSDAQRVTASQRTMYDTLFLRAGARLYGTACAHFYAYGALRGVFTGVRRIAKDDIGDKIYDRTSFYGGGVEVGVRGTYQVGCGFGLLAELAGMALVGNRRDHYIFVNIAPEAYAYARRNITACVPGMDCRLAVNYTYDYRCRYCGLRLVAELGWEMDYYWNMLYQRAVGLGGMAANGVVQAPINFGTNGPYGSLCVLF